MVSNGCLVLDSVKSGGAKANAGLNLDGEHFKKMPGDFNYLTLMPSSSTSYTTILKA